MRGVGHETASVVHAALEPIQHGRVYIVFANRIARAVRVRLDRPQEALAVFRDEIDAGVLPLPTGPLVPQPRLPQLVGEERVALHLPLADVLELPTTPCGIVGETAQELGERPQSNGA